jgi:hypothetical protein
VLLQVPGPLNSMLPTSGSPCFAITGTDKQTESIRLGEKLVVMRTLGTSYFVQASWPKAAGPLSADGRIRKPRLASCAAHPGVSPSPSSGGSGQFKAVEQLLWHHARWRRKRRGRARTALRVCCVAGIVYTEGGR